MRITLNVDEVAAAITALDYCLIEPEGIFMDEDGDLDQAQADAAKRLLCRLGGT